MSNITSCSKAACASKKYVHIGQLCSEWVLIFSNSAWNSLPPLRDLHLTFLFALIFANYNFVHYCTKVSSHPSFIRFCFQGVWHFSWSIINGSAELFSRSCYKVNLNFWFKSSSICKEEVRRQVQQWASTDL